jgi:hypothetical protein
LKALRADITDVNATSPPLLQPSLTALVEGLRTSPAENPSPRKNELLSAVSYTLIGSRGSLAVRRSTVALAGRVA